MEPKKLIVYLNDSAHGFDFEKEDRVIITIQEEKKIKDEFFAMAIINKDFKDNDSKKSKIKFGKFKKQKTESLEESLKNVSNFETLFSYTFEEE